MRERPFGLICIALNIFFWNCFLALGEERDERERQTFVVRYKNGDQTIPVTVVLDYKKQTEYVINMNNRSPAKSVTLYDFKQRTIAYKDLKNRECFLGSLTYETLNEESEALQYIKNPVDAQPIKVFSLDPGRLAMTPTEIRNVAGQKTAVFCRKMTTWMLKPNNQTHNKHKREAGDEEEVEERTYGHHGFHTVRFSHYGHETRRSYRKRFGGASSQETQHGHRKTSSVHPTQNRTLHSWKHPVHHGLNSPDDHEQNSELYLTSNLRSSNENQENRHPFSAHNDIPFSHHPESNENAHNYNKGYGRFVGIPLHTTISDNSDLVSRTERETTPMDILPHYFPLNSNYSLEDKQLPLYRPDEAGIKYESSDFHGEIESNVLPLDYSQNYYPYYNSRPVSDLETYSSSTNDKDSFGKGFQSNKDFFSTDNPVFANSVLEGPNTTEKFESPHQQKPFEHTSHENQSPSFRFYSNEIANSIPSRSKIKHIELNQKEDQSQVSNNYFLKSTEPPNEKNRFLNKDNPIIFSKNHAGLSFPATTQSTFEEHTVENFELINDKKPHESEYKLNAKNLGTYESQESIPTHTSRHKTVLFKNVPNQHRTDLTLTEKERLRFQNEPIGTNWTYTPSHNFNILLTTEQPFLTLTTSDDVTLHHQAKFRNVLKLLKPDEIIIDVGRIPTHSPSEILERFNHKRTFPGTITRQSAVEVSELPLRGAPTGTTQPINTAQLVHGTVPSTFSSFLQPNRNSPRTQDRSEQTSGPVRHSFDRNTILLSGARSHQKRKDKEEGRLQSVPSKFPQGRRSSFQYDQSRGLAQRRIYPHPSRLASQPRRPFPYQSPEQQGELNALPPGVSMHPRHPQAPYADMVRSNVLQSLPDEQRYRQVRPHRQRHHRRKDRVLNPCCNTEKSPNSPSCCRGRGSACCSTSRSRTHGNISCCSSAKSVNSKQTIPANSNRVPVRSSGVLDDSPRNSVDNRDRCQKEKMCRTLYQSTQQVIVCRNAEVNGC